MDYDVLVLGGGIIGCAVAYELSKYNLNIALIEKDYDIADDVSFISSAIVYDGVECEDTLMSRLEIMGSQMFEELTSKFNVPFKRTGSIIIATNEEEENLVDKLYERGIKRGINDIALLSGKYVYELEPNLNINVKKALYSTNTGVINPYDFALAYGEVAFDNGVKFKLEEEVMDIERISKGFKVITNKNKFTCKIVVNTTPSTNYSIDTVHDNIKQNSESNDMEVKYLILDKSFKGNFKNIISSVNVGEKFAFSAPTVQGNSLIAVTSRNKVSNEYILQKFNKFMYGIKNEYIRSIYNSKFYRDAILIDDTSNKGYIRIIGKHYGQITMTPYIATIVCETIVSNINCKLKKDFNDKRREFYRFKDMSNEERNKIIKENKDYGKIVCVCEKITEGEIIDAIRRPLGARTIEGVQRRTGVTLGSCQGANCISKIASILSKETNRSMLDIVKDSKNSKILLSRIKHFDGM